MKKENDLSLTFLWKKKCLSLTFLWKKDDLSWTFLGKKKMICPELFYEKKKWFVLNFLIENKNLMKYSF